MSAPSLDLDLIRTVAGAASPGPWLYRFDRAQYDDWGTIRLGNGRPLTRLRNWDILTEAEVNAHRANGTDPCAADATFIASARTWVPALAIELEAERARNAELEAEIARLRKWPAFRDDFLANPQESP